MGDNRPEFDWDHANRGHVARHNLGPEEVEEAILDPNAILVEIEASSGEERTKALGITPSGQVLAIVFALFGEVIRPITAYPASKQLQALYFKQRQL